MSDQAGPLRQRLQDARTDGVYMKDLTVLATQNDPYRVDTPAGHRDAAWFRDQVEQRLRGRDQLYLRGLHYAISQSEVPVTKPDGTPYINSEEAWVWLQARASKAGRWLGYVPFDLIRDQRNDPPVKHRPDDVEWGPMYLTAGDLDIQLPGVHELRPRVYADFQVQQAFQLVLWGEKSSLSEVLLPIAKVYNADLYLTTGEISDTLIYEMASDAAEDGRPMRVFTVADFDPAGYQMPVSISRKLQAFRDLEFPDLDFEVHPVALDVDHVHDLGLPSTPLKEKERRADDWRDAFDGLEQTEVDALVELRPDVLEGIVTDALDPYFDSTLGLRVQNAERAWEREAQAILDELADDGMVGDIRRRAVAKLQELKEEVETLNEGLRQSVPSDVANHFPPITMPDPVVDTSVHGKPLVASEWDWAEQTRALIARKEYEAGEAA